MHQLLHPLDIVQGDRIGRLLLFPMVILGYHLETLIRCTMSNSLFDYVEVLSLVFEVQIARRVQCRDCGHKPYCTAVARKDRPPDAERRCCSCKTSLKLTWDGNKKLKIRRRQ